MSFERIGPYQLTRKDFIVASLVMTFVLRKGSALRTFMSWIIAGLALIIAGIFVDKPWVIATGFLSPFLVLIAAPAMRAGKTSKDIYMDYDPDGLVIENSDTRIVYKWSMISESHEVGSRLFIFISEESALILPIAAIGYGNSEPLYSTLSDPDADRVAGTPPEPDLLGASEPIDSGEASA